MVGALLFAVCSLALLESGESIKCNTCLMKSPNAECMTGVEGCMSQGEKCMTIRISQDGNEKFRILGCTRQKKKGCGVNKESHGHRISIRCCSSDYCNV
ncbi:lymphocyte antigen 6 complex locus protein G5b-like [Podarcis raffonei]|uniref:lymphocyte antigen 6 complex locus protein G5b-like n=1 Tax=Podarcis raffonei TaxID=65483 RepID=UPI0023295A8B|nr:lymphocyte antigen 6 complex locus protein G5b-like [Podarcis raffonei]